MTQQIYRHVQTTANRLIEKYGQSGNVKRVTPPDPILGGEGSTISYPAKLVPMAYQAREIDGTVILAGDVQIYISGVGLPIEPVPGDLVDANGKTFRVINADPNRYDGKTAVVHVCQGRIA